MHALNFCMITTFYPPYNHGGDGIAVQRLSRALVRRGHRVTVIHDLDAFAASGGDRLIVAGEVSDGVEVLQLSSRIGRASSLLTHQFGLPVVHGRRIREILEQGKFDVVTYHNVSLIGGPGILGLGNAVKLYMAHEHWLVCPTHVLWRHRRERCDRRECLRCVLRYRRPPQLWRYTGGLERALRHVDLFIAPSEFSRRKHEEFGFPREMEVLPYFLPVAEVEEVNGGCDRSPNDRPYFLFVGRLEVIKGLDDVIPVFRDIEADLFIVGEGSHGAHLRTLADGMENVSFLGRMDSAPLSRYLRHCIALIVPSVCFETFGIVLIEAFKEGTPVIARRVGPLPEILEQAKAGALFENGRDLPRVLRRFMEEPVYRKPLEESAARAFSELWSESVVVPRYLELVEKAARARLGRGAVRT